MDHRPPQIFKLHEEVLRHIFELNADMYLEAETNSSEESYGQTPWDHRALNVVRHISQVCQYWRDLVISSSSIWGNVIDLYLLWQENGHWRNEVLRRAGNSSLCIKGVVSDNGAPVRAFFDDLMKNHWSRIRKLDVAVRDYRLLDNEVWITLQHPAPQLELFKLELEGWSSRPLFSTSHTSLFSHNAPSLREFHFTYHPGLEVDLDLRTPWLSQLRRIGLTATFPISRILDALVDMPLLESLELQSDLPDIPVPRRRIDLPRLSRIKINPPTKLRVALSVLESIAAAPGCALILTTIDTRRINVTHEDLYALQKIISEYASGYFGLIPPEGLTVSLSYRTFSFYFPPLDMSFLRPKPPSFCVDMYCDFPLSPGSFNILLDSFSSCLFSKVTTLNIIIGRHTELDKEANTTSRETLASFLSLFPSVEVLEVPEYSLQVLLTIFEQEPRLCRLLDTLKIDYMEPATHLFPDVLLRFLDQREGDGFPIKVLDITGLATREPRDWRFLERKVGLEVVWVQGDVLFEYICGSGELEKLNSRIGCSPRNHP
ncbi:hypothetical protein GALMADRAFT_135543 [Galerina marginata CBS 339.88]|uniref:F-box domain-containing protein n=1 Tax=Galerina marginata (strain CBS 339.88) TaxID=685588 RepID=A0A067TT74_GALM3|nr:hypothetical protein GALMADRAFT_135543 [Galerina marginata CBS 339.88]